MPNAETAEEPRFWTAKQAAHHVGIHVATLYEYCRVKPKRNGHIPSPPFRRIGKRILRFPIVEFKEWASRFDSPHQESKYKCSA